MLVKYIIVLEVVCVDLIRFYGNDLLGFLDINFRNFIIYYKVNLNDFVILLLVKCIFGVEFIVE